MNLTEQAERRKRVNLLKKLIIVFIFAIILVPILLCVILSSRLHSMEQDMEQIRQMLEQISLEQNVELESEAAKAQDEMLTEDDFDQDAQKAPQTAEDTKDNNTGNNDDAQGNGQAVAGENLVTGTDSGMTTSEDGSPQAEMTGQEEKIRKVYLTFDDGPSSVTEQILDILATYDVKATFFVVGKEDEESQAILKRIVDEGHALGMHSYSHVYDDIYGSVEGFAGDLGKLQGYLYDVTGVTSKIYRFPGGSSNKVSKTDMKVFISWLKEQGIEYYDWNISSGDANPVRLTAGQVLDNCTDDLEKYNNAIILMHDAANKKSTVEALPALIEQILGMEDTVILPITEDTKPVQHITN